MSNYFILTLDTTGVSNPTISIESGATYTTDQLIDLAISCSDSDTTGYQIKIWGDVLVGDVINTGISSTEGSSSWLTYTTTKQIKLSNNDGLKTIYLKIRDSVNNESSQTSDSINLDTSLPTVSIIGPDVQRISKITGKSVSTFSFQVDTIFDEYIVKVVAGSANTHGTGTQISISNGSTNMYGNLGNYPANTPINCQIFGADLELASAGDGQKIIKVFVKEKGTGLWSV